MRPVSRDLVVRLNAVLRQCAGLAVHLNRAALGMVVESLDEFRLIPAPQHSHVPGPIEENRLQVFGSSRGCKRGSPSPSTTCTTAAAALRRSGACRLPSSGLRRTGSLTATGTLQALVTVQVGTQVSGPIASLHADFNSEVKKGQVIARLDTTLLYAALADAQSSLARVAAQERQAAEELKRTRALFERALVSQAELDQASAAAQVAAANLASARSQVDRARINLRYAIITFASDVKSCVDNRSLMENDEASYKKASKFVERMDANGQTAMIAALEHVRDKLLPGNNVDTIYFLSDGAPSDGSPEDVMAMVSKIHFDHQIRFHTISITGPKPAPAAIAPPPPPTPVVPPPPSLLEQMARQTGGDFKDL